ncbi:hypothetical protein [Neobacillus niacini]|uniref:hypothetical protein n=1 Tax=Neobacillus niacini TaxID=86668 RepID=UPI0039834AF1
MVRKNKSQLEPTGVPEKHTEKAIGSMQRSWSAQREHENSNWVTPRGFGVPEENMKIAIGSLQEIWNARRAYGENHLDQCSYKRS